MLADCSSICQHALLCKVYQVVLFYELGTGMTLMYPYEQAVHMSHITLWLIGSKQHIASIYLPKALVGALGLWNTP
jgi:hypothetical protein